MYRYSQVAILYVALIFILPANHQVMHDHNLSSLEYKILLFTVVLPVLAIWFVGFFGYAKLQEYAKSIQKTADADGFSRLALGCAWLAWSLPIRSLVNICTGAIANSSPGFHSASVVINNYTGLALSLVAFIMIGSASRHLFERAKISLTSTSMRTMMFLFVVGGVLYCYLIFRQFHSGGLVSSDNPFHLPIWLMVLTIIVPYLYAWFVGILAIYEMTIYSRQVRGVLYRQALQLMVAGLIATVIGSIAFQYASSVRAPDNQLILNTHLFLDLLFRIITGIGFILIALGASRLKKIEEV